MNWQPFIRGGATIGVLLSIAVGLAWSQTAPQPSKVHLDLTQDQLTVVLAGLNELKFKDVLPTYMAIVQQIAPGTAPTEPQPSVALPAPVPATPIPAPPGDAHLLPLAPGTKSDLAPDHK